MNLSKRYIYDALYGIVYLPDFIWDIIIAPEFQRLREIRLCNINSLCLTGGANINRFEHAIGTCHLADLCLESWWFKKDISEKERQIFLIAALLHDIANAPFGHSIEYIEQKRGFKPEDAFSKVVLNIDSEYSYRQNIHEVIFFSNYRLLADILMSKFNFSKEDIEIIGTIINGIGDFGKLISNVIDLDNIDNVYRLAYHIGIVNSGEVPIKLAQSLSISNNELIVNDQSIDLISDWFNVRKTLYKFLLLNPDEFAGKCMLSDAIENSLKISKIPFKWFYSDYDLLLALKDISSDNDIIISRLMTGDLYGCLGIFSCQTINIYNYYVNFENKKELEKKIGDKLKKDKNLIYESINISVHFIKDVNKTERQIKIKSSCNNTYTIGSSTNRVLVGVFLKNIDLSMRKIQASPPKNFLYMIKLIRDLLSNEFNDPNLISLKLYDESNEQ